MIKNILTRDFILAFLAQFAFTSAFYILIPTLPIYLKRFQCTEREIGILIGIFFLSSLVSKLFVGRALIKIPEKRFMIIGTLIFAITSIAYLLISPFLPFFLVRLFQGIGYAFFLTASYTLAANISPERHRGQSMSYFFMAFNLSGALAPPIGIFIINRFNFSYLFFVCFFLSLCSLLFTSQIKKTQITQVQYPSNEKVSFLIRKSIQPGILYTFSFLIWGALAAFFPLYAINHGMSNPGLFFTTTAIMVILGRGVGGKLLDIYSRERIILPCLLSYIISMLILAFSKTPAMFILVAIIWGAGHSLLLPTLVVYALDRNVSSPGPIMGILSAFGDIGISLGPVIMGIIIHFSNYFIMFLSLASISTIGLSYFFIGMRKKKYK